nr:immunoglobulin heavy chain junction region [Mus musculus]
CARTLTYGSSYDYGMDYW